MFKTWTGSGQAMGPVASPSSRGPGSVTGPGGWHPTILYLVVLLILEAALVGFITRTLIR